MVVLFDVGSHAILFKSKPLNPIPPRQLHNQNIPHGKCRRSHLRKLSLRRYWSGPKQTMAGSLQNLPPPDIRNKKKDPVLPQEMEDIAMLRPARPQQKL
jgi:hypothetical protein